MDVSAELYLNLTSAPSRYFSCMFSVFVFQTGTLGVIYCLYSFSFIPHLIVYVMEKLVFYQIYESSIPKTCTKLIHMNQ